MACDEAELPPEEFAKKMEAFKKAQEQQMEMAKLAKNMVDEVQADPKTRDTLMAKARDHNPANASLTDQQIMMNAMQKMALARQKMAEAGLNPDVSCALGGSWRLLRGGWGRHELGGEGGFLCVRRAALM